MSEWLTSMGAGVGNHLWQSTAFAAVCWGVTLLLRRNQARVRYGVWLAASVKFLVPFSLLIGLGGMLPRPHSPVVTMPVYSAVDEVGMPFAVNTLPARTAAATHVSEARHRAPSLPVALAVIWACGVLAVLVIWCGGWWRVTRTLRRARRAEGREAVILRRVEARIGGRGCVRLLLSRELMEPGMFGIWRPVLIWPERLSERLDDEHIEAIVAHELVHAQRRDNLTAALHMVVEAACWFHPMVWWMERRMVEEREHACDEAVVELGSRPGVYAESLLKACRFCVESPLVCVAGITGADLAARVRAIMTVRLKKLGIAGKLALAAFAVAAIAGPVAFGVVRMIPVYGQVFKATGPLPSYEVVAIKPSKDEAHGASTDGEQTQYLVTAKMLIQFAYGVYSPPKVVDLNVVGGPDWINTDVFSIVGKMESAEFEKEQKLGRTQRHERRQLMEQSLLADRFRLKMHTETRDEPVYVLTVMKGLKLTPAKDATGSAHVNPYPSSSSPQELKRGLIVRAKGRGFEMTVKGMTLDTFVDALMAQKETSDRPVVNQTGLTGAYDFTLVWGPEETVASDGGEQEPPLFTAIQQQLGLKLAEGKGPAEVVVIDHIEKPVFDEADAVAKPLALARVVNVAQMEPAPTRSPIGIPPPTPAAPSPPDFQVPRLEVVSVKLNKGTDGYSTMGVTDDGIVVSGTPLIFIIQTAFAGHFTNGTIAGLPSWEMDRYEIVGKVSDADLDKMRNLSPPQKLQMTRTMLQAVLADRFHMKFHDEDKNGPVYELVVAKNGARLSEATPEEIAAGKVRMDQKGTIKGPLSPKELADALTGPITGRVVVDKTGLTDKYDVTLAWAPDHVGPPNGETTTGAAGPSIFTAVQEQLGLKLQPATGPVKGLVIDHIERPSEN